MDLFASAAFRDDMTPLESRICLVVRAGGQYLLKNFSLRVSQVLIEPAGSFLANDSRLYSVGYKPHGRKEKEGQEEDIRLEKRVWEAYTYNNENLHPSPSVVKGYLYPFALSEAYGLLNGSGLASRGLLARYIDNIGLMSKPVKPD
ncbi:hypothetical protein Tco_0318632 [Tanacetum coccineum]